MKFLYLILVFSLMSCSIDDKSKYLNVHRNGNIEVEELFSKFSVFKVGYDDYVPSEVKELKDDNVKVVIFFGTWCHDSKREIPKALKIFNDIGINDKNIELIAVGLDKKEHLGRASKLNLVYTPTLIFFRGSKEIGRIIEKPVISLEKDIELIISFI